MPTLHGYFFDPVSDSEEDEPEPEQQEPEPEQQSKLEIERYAIYSRKSFVTMYAKMILTSFK